MLAVSRLVKQLSLLDPARPARRRGRGWREGSNARAHQRGLGDQNVTLCLSVVLWRVPRRGKDGTAHVGRLPALFVDGHAPTFGGDGRQMNSSEGLSRRDCRVPIAGSVRLRFSIFVSRGTTQTDGAANRVFLILFDSVVAEIVGVLPHR